MDLPSQNLDKIVVDLRCTNCPDGARCDRCQAIVIAAVDSTLASGTDPQHIHVKPTNSDRSYQVMNLDGLMIDGDLRAVSDNHAKAQAMAQGYMVLDLMDGIVVVAPDSWTH